ncbi:DUF4332 domain-containing protein [Gloeocapsopsis dulcis]|uniref:DUF4332 domain-containing protein n=1 Tax=Gloeocapsopsis dulcis AAB1 = 1H9 TaxID=1433147 RepID=A0A6N8G1G7_9CHRO|nr:DUF4332 domain-containing protein [Gloeocapsopsis dulcis]MUL38939.1 hypothetical protein [Gloeocapsopsis dulcis AAB1 = 1H9]WNN90874.1 DUF4332 domain-containing protein [Gloeocapsopsis dulcis]
MQNLDRSPQTKILSKNWQIGELPGLNSQEQAQLAQLGISTTLQLLQQCRTTTQKQALATRLRVRVENVNKWVALADLARIPSVGCQYCGVLLHTGIISVAQLAQTPLHRLHQQILRLQVATFQRRDLCPSRSEIQGWINQARSLVSHS